MKQLKQILFFVSFFFFFHFKLNQVAQVAQIASAPKLASANFGPETNETAKNFETNSEKNEIRKKLFSSNCNVCHLNGTNLILPEKDLSRETLELNGMNTKDSIVYQIINGKNGMPAFGGRLQENEIDEIALYLLELSKQ